MVWDTPSIGLIDPICSKLLDSTPTSSLLLPTTASYLHAFHESLGAIRGYSPSCNPYCAYLEDVPRKIMCSPFFKHAFGFFLMTFGKFKRPLTLFASSLVVFSYLHHCEMPIITFDKLLRALTTSELRTRLKPYGAVVVDTRASCTPLITSCMHGLNGCLGPILGD